MPTQGSSPLRVLGQTLLGLLALQSCVGVQAASGIVEVDLVFPRNDTYRPGRIPFLFAIRNSALAVPLAMEITWGLYEVSGNMTKGDGFSRTLRCDELGQVDPFFTAEGVSTSATTASEAMWTLVWNVQSQNCSATDGADVTQTLLQRRVTFTTKKGAQEPDLLQGTAACARSQGITFNVTGTRAVTPSRNFGRKTCNVLAPDPPPEANVCALSLGSAEAATMAAITSDALWCASPTSAATTTPTTNAAAGRGPGPAAAAHLAGSTWLAFLFFLFSVVGAMAGL